MLLIPFNLKAIHADGDLKDYFGEVPAFLLSRRSLDPASQHPFWSDLERFLSFICQLSSLNNQELDKIKSAYAEEYFNLLSCNIKDYEQVVSRADPRVCSQV